MLPPTQEGRAFYIRNFVRGMALHAVKVAVLNASQVDSLRTAAVRA